VSDQHELSSRMRRRRDREAARRHRRTVAVVASVSIILVVGLALAGWFTVKRLRAERKPKYKTYEVTVPEGLTVKETAARFEEATKGSITAAEFMTAAKSGTYHYGFLDGVPGGNLEGYLFPNTYEVTSQTTARQAVNMMLRDFGKETDDLDWKHASALGVSEYQVVTAASIIEEEVKFAQERPLVASVIYNRLNKKMKLGMCSTVLYALGYWKPKLTDKDTQVDSPYNTYRIDGLPPGPISNPGFESISAALHPAATDYIYFLVTSSDGHQSFTADYKQFAQWKAQQNSK
jgi:UPF0755 protein